MSSRPHSKSAGPIITTHCLPPYLLERPVRVYVVGCGGTGTAVVGGLPYLHKSLLAYGHPGLDVTLFDGDRISPSNVVRQPFAACEVGQYKAAVLASRTNLFHGTAWRGVPESFKVTTLTHGHGDPDLVIGCVDTRAGRRAIHTSLTRKHAAVTYWLDFGNLAASGQFILGQPSNWINRQTRDRLPTVAEQYPELIDADADATDSLPSCSALEALERQEPFVNQTLAYQALAMLGRLFRYGTIPYCGAFVNIADGATGYARPLETGARPARRRRERA